MVYANKLEEMQHFALRMEQYRMEAGLTQSQFAQAIGLSLSGYKKILRQVTMSVKIDTYGRLISLTQKVFWLSHFYNGKFNQIADEIDKLNFCYDARLGMMFEVSGEYWNKPLPPQKEKELIQQIRKIGIEHDEFIRLCKTHS